MSTTPADPLLETLVNDFGGNYVFALDLLEQYRKDRASVETSWRTYFDVATGAASVVEPKAAPSPAPEPAVTVIEAPKAPSAAPAPAPAAGLQTLARTEPTAGGRRSTAVERAVSLATGLGDRSLPIPQ